MRFALSIPFAIVADTCQVAANALDAAADWTFRLGQRVHRGNRPLS